MAILSAMTVTDYLPEFVASVGRTPGVLAVAIGRCSGTLLLRLGIFMAIVAAADVVYQRYAHRKRLRMTKQEVKREHRETEGDPQHKSERQRLHRELVEHQMLESVRRASVVVINPTHLAVAVRYDEEAGGHRWWWPGVAISWLRRSNKLRANVVCRSCATWR